MKYLLIYVLLFFVTPGSGSLHAQDTAIVHTWSIADCFQYAAAHNIQVNTLRLNRSFVQQDLYAARAVKIPGLSASMTNNFNNANNSATDNGNLVNQLISAGSYAISSSVVLWNDNYINNNIRQKRLLERSAELSIDQSLNNISFLITKAYLDILLEKENLTYITDLELASEARTRQGQMFYDAGSIARKELLQLQAQLAADKYLLVQTQNAVRQNILFLKQVLQLPADVLFDIATPKFIAPAATVPSLAYVQQTALKNFPEIKMSKLDLDIAALDISKAKAGFKPILTANGSLGTGYSDVITNSRSPKTGYFKQAGDNFYQRLGLTLSIPIFSNRINKTNIAKANIAFKQADLNLKNTELVLTQEVEQAYLDATNAREAFNAADQQLQAAAESYRIVNEQFRLGSVNAYELLQQRNQYLQAVQAFTAAKYTAVLQQKIYEFYMGKEINL